MGKGKWRKIGIPAEVSTDRAGVVTSAAATLDPGYFALVMATGVISIGLHDQGSGHLSELLLWIAAGGYLVLIALTGWRAIAYRPNLRADLAEPRRGFAFFTFVAGTDVLGARLSTSPAFRKPRLTPSLRVRMTQPSRGRSI